MRTRNGWVAVGAVVVGLLIAAPASAQSNKPAPADEGGKVLAEELSVMAQNTLRNGAVTPAKLREAGALLEAACKLNPGEVRYPRLLAEAMQQVGDSAGAAEALKKVLAIEPLNRTAQAQLIDAYAARMETAEARLKYFEDLLTSSAVDEVKSHVAVLAARQYLERGMRDRAVARAQQAVKLNPLSGEAVRLHYDVVAAGAGPADRFRDLMMMVRANPAQAQVLASAGRELAEAGLPAESLTWYQLAQNVTAQWGMPLDWGVLVDYAAALIVADQPQPAADLLGKMRSADPSYVDVQLLVLGLLKESPNKEQYDAAKRQARVVLANRLAEVRKRLGDAGATTRPIDSPDVTVPDLGGDVKKLTGDATEGLPPGLRDDYVKAVVDLAFFELYFNDNVAEGTRLTDTVRQLLREDSVTVARLDGWAHLKAGRKDEARVKLSAVADRDPLSELGLVKLGGPEAQERANKLVSRYPAGLVGAMAWLSTRDQQAKLTPGAWAADLKKELDAFPAGWLEILTQPQAFYVVRTEAVNGKFFYAYNEPILTRITILNRGKFDIGMGPDGALRPDVWIDAMLRGVIGQSLPGVAFDRITGELVLRPGKQVSQVVRLDQGALADFLTSNPQVPVPISATVTTVPVIGPEGARPGPAGYRTPFEKMYERELTKVLSDERLAAAQQALSGTDAGKKIRALVQMKVALQLLMAPQQTPDPNAEARKVQLRDAMQQVAAGDRTASVSGVAWFLLGTLVGDADRATIVGQLVKDGAWEKRLLGVLLAQMLPPGPQKEAATAASKDAEASVKKFASAMLAALESGEAVVPATQPGTGPAVAPGTMSTTAPAVAPRP